MDKFDKVTLGKANGLKFWSSLALMAASGLIMLQAPLAHADSPAENVRTTELGQRVTFYVQPVYQSDSGRDWQAIPGVKPIKMVGNVGESFQVPFIRTLFQPQRFLIQFQILMQTCSTRCCSNIATRAQACIPQR